MATPRTRKINQSVVQTFKLSPWPHLFNDGLENSPVYVKCRKNRCAAEYRNLYDTIVQW